MYVCCPDPDQGGDSAELVIVWGSFQLTAAYSQQSVDLVMRQLVVSTLIEAGLMPVDRPTRLTRAARLGLKASGWADQRNKRRGLLCHGH